jgi:hypothetical protein
MNRIVTILGVVLFLSVLSLPGGEAVGQVYVGGPAPVTVYRAPAVYGAPVYGAPVTSYYRAPVASYYRAPVTVYRAPVTVYRAPVTVYRAPVTAYYAPAPVVAAPVPVTSYYAPAIVAAPVYYGYRPYYVPGQPVRNVLRATFP